MLSRNVREKNVSINGPLRCQNAVELAKTIGKETFIATDG
jgi:propanediol utilization protein